MFLVSRARSNENTMIRRGHFSRFISDATILRALVFLGRERNPGGEDRVRDISWEGNLCLAGLKEKKIIQEFVSSSSLYRGEYKDAQVSFGLIFSPCRGRYVRERNFGELFSQTVSFLKNFVVK